MRETDKVGYGKVIETKKKHYICIFLTRIQENPDFCGKRKNIYIIIFRYAYQKIQNGLKHMI